MYDEPSSLPSSKPGFQTPGANKRLRSDSNDRNDFNSQTTYQHNNTSNNLVSTQRMTSSNQNEFPPITIEFSEKPDISDRLLVEELIMEWKHKNKRDINIIGKFDFRKGLLIFARDSTTLEELLVKSQWPNKLGKREFKIKIPTRLPDSFSLIIRDFQQTWAEIEAFDDLKTKHLTLQKLTRLVARNGRSLRAVRAVRADFSSSKYVKHLFSLGEIELNHMKLQVGTYYSPVKINKCKKCHKHDHFTSQCNSEQLCMRCGQHHPFENGCQNEMKCVNCQQNHYSGHASFPVVQQKRKLIAEQQKIQRAQMLIRQQQSFEYSNTSFPPLSPHSSLQAVTRQANETLSNDQMRNKPLYSAVFASKKQK